jgi:hypothetical protein
MKMTTTVTARVDFENNAEEFWTEFRNRVESLDRDSELAANCRKILKSDEVELMDASAIEEFDTFVTAIPGFGDGPQHAKTAILFQGN